MPRRRPGRVRAEQVPRLRHLLTEQVSIAGLSAPARAEVARIERSRNYLWPGVTADSVRMWRGFVRDPYRNLWSEYEDGGCSVWECCGSPFEAREFLDAVIHGMSRRRARELRLLVDRLDNSY